MNAFHEIEIQDIWEIILYFTYDSWYTLSRKNILIATIIKAWIAQCFFNDVHVTLNIIILGLILPIIFTDTFVHFFFLSSIVFKRWYSLICITKQDNDVMDIRAHWLQSIAVCLQTCKIRFYLHLKFSSVMINRNAFRRKQTCACVF